MPLKYMLATRTSSARDMRSAGGVGAAERRARLAERLEVLGAALAVRDEGLDLGDAAVPSTLSRTARIIGVARLAHRR